MITAPARRRLATTALSSAATASRSATTPLVVAHPRWSTLTLVVTGTPCSGPSVSPALTAASAASAAASASASSTSTTALIAGLTAAQRRSAASVASRADTWRRRMALARSTASQVQISVEGCTPVSPSAARGPRQSAFLISSSSTTGTSFWSTRSLHCAESLLTATRSSTSSNV